MLYADSRYYTFSNFKILKLQSFVGLVLKRSPISNFSLLFQDFSSIYVIKS